MNNLPAESRKPISDGRLVYDFSNGFALFSSDTTIYMSRRVLWCDVISFIVAISEVDMLPRV